MQNNPERAKELLRRSIEQFEAQAKTARADGFPIRARGLDTLAQQYREKLKALESQDNPTEGTQGS